MRGNTNTGFLLRHRDNTWSRVQQEQSRVQQDQDRSPRDLLSELLPSGRDRVMATGLQGQG